MTLEKPERVYLKCTLRGDPALIVLELKERGIVGSVRKAVVHGLLQVTDTTSGRPTTIKVFGFPILTIPRISLYIR